MSYFGEELARQMELKDITGVQLAERTGISASQIYNWLKGVQTSVSEEQLNLLGPSLSEEITDHAALVLAHLQDEKFGLGSELIRMEIEHGGMLKDRPKTRSKGERAIAWLSTERLKNRELNELLIQLAEMLGTRKPD